MKMQHTPEEQKAWSEHAPFFEPNGLLDNDACTQYLQIHLSRSFQADRAQPQDLDLLYALIKKTAHLPEAEKTFVRIYNGTRATSARVQELLEQLTNHEPELLRQWLKTAVAQAGVTEQILLLRDIKYWQPNEPVGSYVNQNLLTMKPATFVKKFTPETADMQYLLSVGLDFQKDPRYAHLGLLMVQGVFIAMYGKEHVFKDDKNPKNAIPRGPWSELESKYSAREAFELMQTANVPIAPDELLQLIKVRYKAQCLESDALGYCYEKLCVDGTPAQKEYALDVLGTVLASHQQDPHNGYNQGLFMLYTALENQPQYATEVERIKSALVRFLHTATMPAGNTFPMLQYAPSFAPIWVSALQAREQDTNNQKLIGSLYFGERIPTYLGLAISYREQHPAIVALLHQRTTPEQLTHACINYFYQNIGAQGTHAAAKATLEALQKSMHGLAKDPWPREKLEHLKASNIVPKWVLAHLFLAANIKAMPGLSLSSMPNLNQEPLPFLRMLYPEHTPLWNTMQKSIFLNETKNEVSLENYQQKHAQLFTLFSTAFLKDNLSLASVNGIAETMGVDPLEVVIAACEQAHALSLDNIDNSLFEFGMP